MDNVFVTLFDSNYLDKGLVLYDSMAKHMKSFKLYVLAFDDKCYEILKKENLPNLVVISLKEFESDDLLVAKGNRTKAEYCWTCSSWSIKYVLDKYNEDICTYIDSDMAFFADPSPIFEQMRKNNQSIIIVPHRFKNEKLEQKAKNEVGMYCVEFNTFLNNHDGRQALEWWCNSCLEWCYYAIPGTTEWYGDQKYLNVFPEKFNGVMVCNHVGVGLAPWNVKLVIVLPREQDEKQNNVLVKEKKTGNVFPLVIYHFESVYFVTKHILNVSSGVSSKNLHHQVCDGYVSSIVEKRRYLADKYGILFSNKRRILTNNPLMKFYQKYVSPLKRIKRLSDLYWVKTIKVKEN